ncbi:uncharacterized protein LOC135216701 [Macrobrachium nipponense]|uniref:uncharacterized protein LOC135216701 n=1 Tax=Macrobrachium nipponense TaxID=159736 RepID=UPI0030C88B2A
MSGCLNEDLSQCAGVGDLLSGSWELTQRIFENLSFREVARLRAVCKLWADVGAKILERRRKLHYLTVHPHHVPTTEGKVIISSTSPITLFEKFFEHIVSKPRYCIGFCNEDWLHKGDVFTRDREKEKVRLAQYILGSLPSTCDFRLISASGIIGTVEQNYQGHLLESANSMNQELLSLLYSKDQEEGGLNKNKDQEEGRPCKRSRRCSTTESLDNDRPENSPDTSTSNESSLSGSENLNKSSVGYSIEVEARWNSSSTQAEAVTLLLIPHHPGVKLKFFHISEESFFKEYRQEESSTEKLVITPEEFNGITSLSPEDDLKALLFFDVGLDEGFTSAFITSALHRQNYKMAVGGGVVECFDCGKEDPRKVTSQSNLGIAVCGPNVMAVSVIIPKSVGNPKNLDDYMKQLKSCGLPEGQSLAFMFTCCGRGFSWYRRRGNPWFDYNNVETKAFRKFFPNTPVFGFFGGGEIGMPFLPKFNESNDETEEVPSKKWKRRLFHQFTTVIVLLSFL